MSCAVVPPSLKLCRPSELVARRSLGGDGIRASVTRKALEMDCRASASGSDAVLRTAMPGNDGAGYASPLLHPSW
jgi:hypothetical protein